MPNHEYDLHYVSQIAGFSKERKLQLFKFFTMSEESVRLEAFALMIENTRNIRHEKKIKRGTETVYAGFLVALDAMLRLEESTIRTREPNLDKHRAKMQFKTRVSRVKARRQKSTLVKRLIEIRLYDEIKRLRGDERMSWRRIATFIKRYHRIQISHTYLREAFLKVERIRQTAIQPPSKNQNTSD